DGIDGEIAGDLTDLLLARVQLDVEAIGRSAGIDLESRLQVLVTAQGGNDRRGLFHRELVRRGLQIDDRRVAADAANRSRNAKRCLLRPQRQILDRDAVLVTADDAGQIVHTKMRALASQRDVADIDLHLVRVARDPDRRIDPVDHLWHDDAGGAHRLAFEVERAVADADLADLDRLAVPWLVRRLRLDQFSEIPASRGLL